MRSRFNDGTDYKLPSLPAHGRRLIRVYEYWTDFSRDNSSDYKLLNFNPGSLEYWRFVTSLDEDSLTVFMTPKEQRNFLFKMLREYKG